MKLVRIYIRVLSLLAPNATLAWTLALGNLALAATQFVEPVLLGKVIDTLSGQAGSTAISSRLVGLLGIWAVFGLFNIACSTLVALFADRLAHCRRHAVLSDYFEHVLQLPLAYHGARHSGRLMKIMLQGTDALWGIWVAFFRESMVNLVSFVVLLPLALYMNWRLAILLVLLGVVFTGLTAFVVGKSEQLQMEVEEHYSALAERASDTLGNIPLVHSFARVQAEVSGLKNVISKLLAAQLPVLSWWAVISVLTRASTTITMLSIVVIGAILNRNGQASVGEIVTFMNFATMLIDRMQHAVSFVNRLVGETPRLQQFFEVIDTAPALQDRPGAIEPERLRGRVAFRDVSFSYGGEMRAVSDLSFVAEPGDTIALVGATGAGKSTALALLHRAFDPQSGVIEIDGRDIRDYALAGLRRNIGVVFQEAMLFNRSIRDNLLIGKSDATDEEILVAVTRAQALDFVERAPEGLDSRVGERGRLLSGGERQRLSIARALLKNPPIMILDEATSALDSQTEAKVMVAFDEVMKGRTTFVIAHRLATIRNATRILVFQAGRIVESGTFAELTARDGHFAALARSQYLLPAHAAAAAE
jgi:ATP-binding cassette subfamily B protein